MASSPGPTSTRTSPVSSSSINSPSPSVAAIPTPNPISSYSDQQLYYAYAIPLEDAGDRQDIQNIQVGGVSSRSRTSRSIRQGYESDGEDSQDGVNGSKRRREKGKEREWDGHPSGLEPRSPRSSSKRSQSDRSHRSGSKRRRGLELGLVSGFEDARKSLEKRLPTAEGYPSCNYVGNGVLSCYPESNTTIVQGDYSKFIWNAQYPTFIGAGDVDIYLYNANTEDIATSWLGVQNARGMIGITPDDEWWPQESAAEWFNSDRNRTIPYYFIVVDGGSQLTGGETHQSTFTVIQTAPPSSLSSTLAVLTASSLSSVSSLSSLSAASASSQSLASQSSSAAAAASSGRSSNGGRTTNANGELQPSNGGGGGGPAIPKWAIAIIVILGFFALVAGTFAIVFCLGRARRRRREAEQADATRGGGDEGGAGGAGGTEDGFSSGSREPMLGGTLGGGGSPSITSGGTSMGGLAPALAGGAGALGGGAALGAIAGGAGGKKDEANEDEKSGLDRNDAARMAEAFRAALRRPEFPSNGGTESSGESGALLGGGERGEEAGNDGNSPGEGEDGRGRELIEEELKSEGMSMRDVQGGGGKRWG